MRLGLDFFVDYSYRVRSVREVHFYCSFIRRKKRRLDIVIATHVYEAYIRGKPRIVKIVAYRVRNIERKRKINDVGQNETRSRDK